MMPWALNSWFARSLCNPVGLESGALGSHYLRDLSRPELPNTLKLTLFKHRSLQSAHVE